MSSASTVAVRGPKERNLGVYVVLVFAALVSAGPLLIVLINSLRTDAEITTQPLGWPSVDGLGNYARAWEQASVGMYLFNSLVVTVGAMALALVVGLPAAYAIGRWSFPGKWLVSVVFLSGLMVPLRIGVLPLYHLFQGLGLADTLLGLILIYAVSALPMTTLILSVFYRALPDTLEDAAMVDGAGYGTVFLRIYTPLVIPAIATAVVLNIGPAWNDFFFPLIMQRSPQWFTLPVGISTFFGEFAVDRGLLFAGLVLAAAPLAIVFALSMKYVVGGLTAGMGK